MKAHKAKALALTAILAGLAPWPVVAESSVGTTSTGTHHDKQAWAISLDNDLFVPAGKDRDFTAGLALTYTGCAGVKYWQGLDDGLAALDDLHGLGASGHEASQVTPSIEIGSYGFTPDNIEARDVQQDERPYASLLYLSASRIYQATSGRDAWTSAITLGVLGADVFEGAQDGVHHVTGSDKPRGWDHQISDGGELTLRYQTAYHQYWNISSPSVELKTTYFGSVGYLTEGGIALSTRSGRISSPDYRFNPELISYGERVNDVAAAPYAGRESYFWGGVALKARAYNAFLQGQFRDSDHTLHASELRPLLAEAWIGYTLSFSRELKFSYVLRAQTSEIKKGEGDRNLLWGGLVLSQSF
jgi:hypothetical protein